MTPLGNAQLTENPDGELLFMTQLKDLQIRAVLSEATWEARYGRLQSDASLREIYMANRPLIEAAVVRRFHTHKEQPVVLHALDL